MGTIIVFILILSLLIFVHELGHFITAKKAGIVVEEFGIGYPPRAIKVWQDEGKITLDGHEMIIGRKTKVPRDLHVDSEVYVETQTRPDGLVEITKIETVDPTTKADSDQPTIAVESLEKPTEYSINWIPFGGFVKMLGEEDPTAPGSFASKSKKTRLIVLVAGAAMNLITAFIVFTIMFMTGQPEPIGPTYITHVAPNSPAEKAGIQPNDIILKVDEVVIESSRDLVEYTQAHKGEKMALTILRGETELQISLVPRVNPPPGEGAMGVGIQTQYTQLWIKEIDPASPAEAAGLEIGDTILRVDGNIIGAPSMLIDYLQEHQNQSVTLSILRGETNFETTVWPDVVPSDQTDTFLNTAVSLPVPALGTVVEANFIEQRVIKLPPGEAVIMGATATVGIVIQTFIIPVAIIKRIIPVEQARPVGPLGIYQITDTAVDVSREKNEIYPLLFLTAVLSTALAVTNLLPLPALDGGRIIFIILEAIRGKRISPEKEGAIHFIGLAILLSLMVVISYYDFTNPIDVSNLFR
jgi:regulator of sigma E protease